MGCLSFLAACAIGWSTYVWSADDPPDVGAPAILFLGLAALIAIYVGSAVDSRLRTNRDRLPDPPKRSD